MKLALVTIVTARLLPDAGMGRPTDHHGPATQTPARPDNATACWPRPQRAEASWANERSSG
jgi:hypothetical protein